LAGCAGVQVSALFRLLRLFGTGARLGAPVRGTVATELQLSVSRPQHRRLLAALAYDAVALSARLHLHPARRQPNRHTAALSEPPDHDGDFRVVAWRGLAFRLVGHPAGGRHGLEPRMAAGVAPDPFLVVAH